MAQADTPQMRARLTQAAATSRNKANYEERCRWNRPDLVPTEKASKDGST